MEYNQCWLIHEREILDWLGMKKNVYYIHIFFLYTKFIFTNFIENKITHKELPCKLLTYNQYITPWKSVIGRLSTMGWEMVCHVLGNCWLFARKLSIMVLEIDYYVLGNCLPWDGKLFFTSTMVFEICQSCAGKLSTLGWESAVVPWSWILPTMILEIVYHELGNCWPWSWKLSTMSWKIVHHV